MSRSYLFRRPKEDDNIGTEIVHAKPIDEKYSKRLGDSFGGGRDFVRGSEKSQSQFYGDQTLLNAKQEECMLSHDERNKLQAKILKAELKGNMSLASELRHKLEKGIASGSDSKHSNEKQSVLLLEVNKRSGLVVPARKGEENLPSSSKDGHSRHTIDYEYRRSKNLQDLLAEEKQTSAEDQIKMFNQAAKMTSNNKVDDDWVVDDNLMSHPKKRRHEEKNKRKEESKRIKGHKDFVKTLDKCRSCLDSKNFEKEAIIAIGFKTYLTVCTFDGLDIEQCLIRPTEHYSNSLVLDEDVFAEMRLWRKGLCQMWRDGGKDCIFVEDFRNNSTQPHMAIECIPVPDEIGDLAPIYFKKAIMESDKEEGESDNKKLIELLKCKTKDIRSAIPKGFPFFAIDFGLQPGYAHVIENDSRFPSYFAQEIVGNLLDLSPNHWRNPKLLKFDEVKIKRDSFQKKWDKYDWTKLAKRSIDS